MSFLVLRDTIIDYKGTFHEDLDFHFGVNVIRYILLYFRVSHWEIKADFFREKESLSG